MIRLVLFLVFCFGNSEYIYSQYYEYEFKSGFIYQFSRYTTWSGLNSSKKTFEIGILGENPLGTYIYRVTNNRTVHGKAIVIKHSFSVNELKTCQVIFIGKSEEYTVKETIDKINNFKSKYNDILTIGDGIKDFCKNGGMINFVEKDNNKYFFNINIDAINKNNLILNSKVLKIANKVITNGGN